MIKLKYFYDANNYLGMYSNEKEKMSLASKIISFVPMSWALMMELFPLLGLLLVC